MTELEKEAVISLLEHLISVFNYDRNQIALANHPHLTSDWVKLADSIMTEVDTDLYKAGETTRKILEYIDKD